MSQSQDWLSSKILLSVLQEHPEGISEHALLMWLQKHNHIHFESDEFHNTMKLFRIHFLLFHRLYQLKDELHATQQGSLNIHTLSIRFLPYQEATAGLVIEDPLRTYYLDFSNLQDTNEKELDEMLANFWTSLGRFEAKNNLCQKRQQALDMLELDSSATDKEVKRAWRRLAMKHHPDRGGDEEQIKALNHAVSLLLSR